MYLLSVCVGGILGLGSFYFKTVIKNGLKVLSVSYFMMNFVLQKWI